MNKDKEDSGHRPLSDTRSYSLAARLWPDVALMDEQRQFQAVETIVRLFYLLPFAVVGLVWLIIRTDYAFLRQNLDSLAILFVAMLLLLLQPFTVRVRLGRADAGQSDAELPITTSLAPLVMWSALFISGAAGLWALVLASAVAGLWRSRQRGRYGQNPIWDPLATFIQEMTAYLFATIVAAEVYLAAGGAFPITGTEAGDLLPALAAVATGALLSGLLILPVAIQVDSLAQFPFRLVNLARFYLGAVALPLIMSPFSIMIALLNIEGRTLSLVFALVGIYLVNRLAHHFSKAEARSRQQAREFVQLQALSEALIEAPADASTLPEVLASLLSHLFPVERAEIRLFEAEKAVVSTPFRVAQPADLPAVSDELWQQVERSDKPYLVLPKVRLTDQRWIFGDALAIPIMAEQTGPQTAAPRRIGGIYLLRHVSVGQTLDSLATVQSLADQVASAVYRARVHAEEVAFRKTQQELEFAGRIQSSFLPAGVPQVDKWQIAAVLDSARQTSGDFYDFIPLGEGLIGILVADVSDKGTGAALYMALSRTLIRTYAMEEPANPEIALQRANERIRADTESDQFVTVFYGVLNTETGRLAYANAGHNPAYLLRNGGQDGHESLVRTGIPLGMFEGMAWQQVQVQLNPADLLLIYSDGVTEAQNTANEEYHDDRLIAVGTASAGKTAEEIKEAIMASIYDFVGDAPQFDDITLMVVTRAVEE